MAFLPYESKVFTLDYPDVIEDFYSRDRVNTEHMSERIADQLATVCSMMGEYPCVRYRTWGTGEGGGRGREVYTTTHTLDVCIMIGLFWMCVFSTDSEVSRTAEIAEALQNRLDAYKAEKRELGSVSPPRPTSLPHILSVIFCNVIRTPSKLCTTPCLFVV